ncbi:hypothetical protein [Pseudobacteriovorax antillogorgiicola]|uniref:Uncharacterized protein n=1 Tax=Pseudobacteriovorax antillogorgiicola TaxID=1513793 RepID=A0A1Y6CLQ6_9BACT|nr:hypothetical protein [Pseudobacteriovorax antillogorgiicola]TCS45444.1 hypothetical protein EDD56_12855 [Pseudobacteriovorax antillogorgiicola]SMF74581.1 hypothetical protein SAMN06296036_12855 [Pseudobacteriovorax antillogorgiicola]
MMNLDRTALYHSGYSTLCFALLLSCNQLNVSRNDENSKPKGVSPTESPSETESAVIDTQVNEPVMAGGGFLHCSYVDPSVQNQVGCGVYNPETNTKKNLSGIADQQIQAFDLGGLLVQINFRAANQDPNYHWLTDVSLTPLLALQVKASSQIQGLANQDQFVSISDEIPSIINESFAPTEDAVMAATQPWYLGDVGINCLTTCQNRGGVNQQAMEDFSSAQFCSQVLTSLNLTVDSVDLLSFANRPWACLYRPDLRILYVAAVQNIDANASQGGMQRLCSCQN